MQDIVITPYEKLGIIEKRLDAKRTVWNPNDLTKQTKFKFAGRAFLDFGHIILDQSNIQL